MTSGKIVDLEIGEFGCGDLIEEGADHVEAATLPDLDIGEFGCFASPITEIIERAQTERIEITIDGFSVRDIRITRTG